MQKILEETKMSLCLKCGKEWHMVDALFCSECSTKLQPN